MATIQILDQIDTQLVFLFLQLITLKMENKWLSHHTSLFFQTLKQNMTLQPVNM